MSQLQEYKCPCCGGSLQFDSGVQKMKCPYCDTEFEMETLKSLDEILQQDSEDEMRWESQAGTSWQPDETENLRSYVCKSCAGEILGDATTAATRCPYCDNPVVMMEQFSGELKPDYVIPFKLDKEAAKTGFRKYLEGKRLLPKVFKDEAHIDEIKGIYVPFWMFNTDADVNMRFLCTRNRTWSDPKYIYHETSYYSVLRGGTVEFERVPVDGSTKMADDLMESIEPYDFGQAVDFQTAYLAGYLADKYDVTAQESADRANERIKKSAESLFASTVRGYGTVSLQHSSVKLSGGVAKYVLCPVWLLNTTWEGTRYVFAMNGQTGKFVGNLPLDKKAYRKWLWGLTGIVGAAVYLFLLLFWLL